MKGSPCYGCGLSFMTNRPKTICPHGLTMWRNQHCNFELNQIKVE